VLLARNNPHTLINPAPIDFPYDFNHDRRVNATDMLIARSSQTHLLNALKLIATPESKGGTDSASPTAGPDVDQAETATSVTYDAVLETTAAKESETSSAKLDWLFEFEPAQSSHPSSEKDDRTEDAVDKLLQIWSS